MKNWMKFAIPVAAIAAALMLLSRTVQRRRTHRARRPRHIPVS